MLIEEMIRIGPFLAPDILFVLHVNTAESMRRRSAFSKDERYKIWFDQAFFARFKDYLNLAADCLPTRKTIAIDTTHLNPSAIVHKVINLVEFCGPPFREPL
jgi:thymidylate kinase